MEWLSTAETRPWLRAGSTMFLSAVDGLADDAFDEVSALAGWTRRHLIAHLGLNAQALRNLVRSAATGEPSPMYSSMEQRSADIEAASSWRPARLRALVHDSAAALDGDLDALAEDRWAAEVRTAQGRAVPATEIVWMRVREVAVHSVDLGVGIGFDDLPRPLCEALIGDIAARRSAQSDGPAADLLSSEGRAWAVGGIGEAVTVRASAADLAAWLAGRGAGGCRADSGGLPELGPWL